jgi:hypothetical protein
MLVPFATVREEIMAGLPGGVSKILIYLPFGWAPQKYERPVATWQQARQILGLRDAA